MAAMAREPSVQAFVRREDAGGTRAAKLTAFFAALRGAADRYMANAVSLDEFELEAWHAWVLA